MRLYPEFERRHLVRAMGMGSAERPRALVLRGRAPGRWPVLGVLLVGLWGCDDERTSGGAVGPPEGPRVAESVLALDVVGGAPVGITDTFLQDEFVNLWVLWQRLDPPHTVETIWINPDGRERSNIVEVTDAAAEQVTVARLELTSQSLTGRWAVELYLDGEFMRSHAFLVLELLP